MERRKSLIRNFRCQKYVKKGYMEMTKKIYLETLKSVLGRSILHYSPPPPSWLHACHPSQKTKITTLHMAVVSI